MADQKNLVAARRFDYGRKRFDKGDPVAGLPEKHMAVFERAGMLRAVEADGTKKPTKREQAYQTRMMTAANEAKADPKPAAPAAEQQPVVEVAQQPAAPAADGATQSPAGGAGVVTANSSESAASLIPHKTNVK